MGSPITDVPIRNITNYRKQALQGNNLVTKPPIANSAEKVKELTPTPKETAKTRVTLKRSVMSQNKQPTTNVKAEKEMTASAADASMIIIGAQASSRYKAARARSSEPVLKAHQAIRSSRRFYRAKPQQKQTQLVACVN